MAQIPTAEEFYNDNLSGGYWGNSLASLELKNALIEFAKLHVEAALKSASQKAIINTESRSDGYETWDVEVVDEDSILSAYPLNNIK